MFHDIFPHPSPLSLSPSLPGSINIISISLYHPIVWQRLNSDVALCQSLCELMRARHSPDVLHQLLTELIPNILIRAQHDPTIPYFLPDIAPPLAIRNECEQYTQNGSMRPLQLSSHRPVVIHLLHPLLRWLTCSNLLASLMQPSPSPYSDQEGELLRLSQITPPSRQYDTDPLADEQRRLFTAWCRIFMSLANTLPSDAITTHSQIVSKLQNDLEPLSAAGIASIECTKVYYQACPILHNLPLRILIEDASIFSGFITFCTQSLSLKHDQIMNRTLPLLSNTLLPAAFAILELHRCGAQHSTISNGLYSEPFCAAPPLSCTPISLQHESQKSIGDISHSILDSISDLCIELFRALALSFSTDSSVQAFVMFTEGSSSQASTITLLREMIIRLFLLSPPFARRMLISRLNCSHEDAAQLEKILVTKAHQAGNKPLDTNKRKLFKEFVLKCVGLTGQTSSTVSKLN